MNRRHVSCRASRSKGKREQTRETHFVGDDDFVRESRLALFPLRLHGYLKHTSVRCDIFTPLRVLELFRPHQRYPCAHFHLSSTGHLHALSGSEANGLGIQVSRVSFVGRVQTLACFACQPQQRHVGNSWKLVIQPRSNNVGLKCQETVLTN